MLIKKKTFFIFCIFISLILIVFFTFFKDKGAKNYKIGNNSSSQEIVDYILNISSYEATINVDVTSSKNTNKYIIKQKCEKTGIITQEVIEPSNISGVRIIKEGDNLKIENTTLNLNLVLERYNYISDNVLDLDSFIENYKNNSESKFGEKNEQVIMETVDNSNNKNLKHKTLYIDRNTAKPTKMEIKDTNKNSAIYIIYNEVNVNSLN